MSTTPRGNLSANLSNDDVDEIRFYLEQIEEAKAGIIALIEVREALTHFISNNSTNELDILRRNGVISIGYYELCKKGSFLNGLKSANIAVTEFIGDLCENIECVLGRQDTEEKPS